VLYAFWILVIISRPRWTGRRESHRESGSYANKEKRGITAYPILNKNRNERGLRKVHGWEPTIKKGLTTKLCRGRSNHRSFKDWESKIGTLLGASV